MKIELTKSEIDALIWAAGNHCEALAFDIDEMMSEGMTRYQAKALTTAFRKLRAAIAAAEVAQ